MPKFKLDKLIRNKLLNKIIQHDVRCKSKTLTESEYKDELFVKLDEEIAEVKQATDSENLIEELADVLEVIEAICVANNLDFKEVLKQKQEKFAEEGTFTVNSFIKSFEFNDDPKLKSYIDYYRKNQNKYPEIF